MSLVNGIFRVMPRLIRTLIFVTLLSPLNILADNPKAESGSNIEGPLWLRFKIEEGVNAPFFIHCSCHFATYDSKEPKDAGWLFRKEVFPAWGFAEALMSDWEKDIDIEESNKHLLNSGEWLPWVRTFTGQRFFFTAEVKIFPRQKHLSAEPPKDGLQNIAVRYQAAVKPDSQSVIREGFENTGVIGTARICIPPKGDLESMRRGIRSYSEWADERLEMVKELGFKAGEGPRKIKVITMCNPLKTQKENESYIESCRLLGFSGLNIHQNLIGRQQIWEQLAAKGFTATTAHHLALGIGGILPSLPRNGQTMQQTIDRIYYESALARIHHIWDGAPKEERDRIALGILVDEPVAMPWFVTANCEPAVRRSFHEFLETNKLTPQFFGKSSWDKVDMIGYTAAANKEMIEKLRKSGIDLEYVESSKNVAAADLIRYERRLTNRHGVSAQESGKKKEPDGMDIAEPTATGDMTNIIDELRRDSLESDAAEAKQRWHIQIPIIKGLRVAGTVEKKQYYWAQRFRSYFTRHCYGQASRAIESLAKQGFLPADIKVTPNFQAAPMMEAQMWDGSLDLFEWAQDNSSNSLMVEDWMNDPYRVSFGLALLNSAARKNGQSLAHLITADGNFRNRYMTSLAMGVQTFQDYLYGPYGVIGPAWASNPDEVRGRAEMLRLTRKAEDDLIVSKLRPSETALLVANSAEINTAYYNTCAVESDQSFFRNRPLFRRAGIYAALLDGGFSTEIVSETGIIEDKELDRYKVLYAVDTHVSTAVQEAIRNWVSRGGTLWADYTAFARNEYDEDSKLMNDVFGLAERGPLPAPATSKGIDEEVLRVTGNTAEEAGMTATSTKVVDKNATPEKISIISHDKLEAVTFAGSLFRPSWKLSTAKPIGFFTDGSPALISNQFGKGRAILLGCSSIMLSHYSKQSSMNQDFDKVRQVALLGTAFAGVKKACRIDIPRINTYVRDGADQTVLVLINSTGTQQNNIKAVLTVPYKINSAFDGRGRNVVFTQSDEIVKFSVNLDANDGEIIVFRR